MNIQLKKHYKKYGKYKKVGIPWLGEVPEDWSVEKLKYFATIIAGQSPDGTTVNNSPESGLPFLQGKAEFGVIHPLPINYCSAPKKIAKKGSLLLSVRAPVGELNLADRDYCIGRGLAAVNSDNQEYLSYALFAVKKHLSSLSTGSTFEAISTSDLNQTVFPKPSVKEQSSIADYLDEKSALIERIIEAKKKQIELLEEYKSSLISHVVTGKIKITNS